MPGLPNEALRERIFEMALQGRSVRVIAQTHEVDESLVRAALRTFDYHRRVEQMRAEVFDATKASLHATAELAVLQLRNVIAGRVKGAGANAIVRASEAVLDRVGIARGAEAAPQAQRDAERVNRVLLAVIARHPELAAETTAAIESDIAHGGDIVERH
jgi:hypothetical protein